MLYGRSSITMPYHKKVNAVALSILCSVIRGNGVGCRGRQPLQLYKTDNAATFNYLEPVPANYSQCIFSADKKCHIIAKKSLTNPLHCAIISYRAYVCSIRTFNENSEI